MPISHGKDVNHDLFQGFTIASTRRDVIWRVITPETEVSALQMLATIVTSIAVRV